MGYWVILVDCTMRAVIGGSMCQLVLLTCADDITASNTAFRLAGSAAKTQWLLWGAQLA